MLEVILLALAGFAAGALPSIIRLLRDWKYADRRTRRYRQLTRALIWGTLVASVVLIALSVRIGYRDLRRWAQTALQGTITPEGDAPFARFSIGGRSYRVTAANGIVFRDGQDELLVITFEGGTLVVSASFRDETGSIIAKVIRNEWAINPNRFFQRNYTRNGLEVVDEKDNVTLQVLHVGNTVDIQGTLRCRIGRTIQLVAMPELRMSTIVLARKGMPPLMTLKPMCTYPSDAHIGECPGFDARRVELQKYVPPAGVANEKLWDTPVDLCSISPEWDRLADDGKRTIYLIVPTTSSTLP